MDSTFGSLLLLLLHLGDELKGECGDDEEDDEDLVGERCDGENRSLPTEGLLVNFGDDENVVVLGLLLLLGLRNGLEYICLTYTKISYQKNYFTHII